MKDVKININKNNNSDKELELFYSNQDILEVEDIEQEYTFENIEVEPDPIIIEISGLKGAGKFIYLDDTPTYYENGKFLRILDNKISYADIYWNDINGNIEERKDLIDLIKKLTDVQIQDEIKNEVKNGIQKHNEALDSHPVLHEKITNDFNNTNEKIDAIKLETDSLINSNYTTLDTKIDTTKSELDSTINELTETVNSNYTTLNTKIDTTKSELDSTINELTETVNSNYTTLNTKIDTTKSELDGTISDLENKVDNNYTTLNTKIDTTKSELDGTISDLTKTVQDNYTTLDTKIDTTKSELDGTISDLENKVDNNYTTLNTKIDTTKSELDGTISDLENKVDNNYTTLNTKIDTTKSELDGTISDLENKVDNNYTTLDTKIDTTKSELDGTISDLTKTVQDNYTTLDTNKANKATTLLGYGITDTYTKKEVDAKTASVYRPKGSVSSYDDLPTENLAVGDTYNILDTGANYVWTDDNNWDKLSETVDLTPFLTKEDALKTYDTINSVDIKISTIQNTKQDRLTAGDGISIKDNVISGAKIIIRDWSK